MPTIAIEVDRDGPTRAIQISIVDQTAGVGYRLCGPKYSGNSRSLAKATIDEHAAREIRRFLDRAFPPREGAS